MPTMGVLHPVVDRWVDVPRGQISHLLRAELPPDAVMDLAAAQLRLEGAFTQSVDAGRVVWRAPARLVIRGASAVRFARVDIEVVAWSDDFAEVTVRPRGRQLVTWGERRERRYFRLAHEAATRIAQLLSRVDVAA